MELMKCLSCDCILSDFEATRKYEGTTDYIDLCNTCYSYIVADLTTTDRFDLYDPEVDDLDVIQGDSQQSIYIMEDDDDREQT